MVRARKSDSEYATKPHTKSNGNHIGEAHPQPVLFVDDKRHKLVERIDAHPCLK